MIPYKNIDYAHLAYCIYTHVNTLGFIMEYSEKEMAIVTQACISIFVLVAKSDGTISKAEEKTFLDSYAQILRDSQLIDALQEQFIFEAFTEKDRINKVLKRSLLRTTDQHLASIRRALSLVKHKEDSKVFTRYCGQMNKLANSIAEASRGRFGLGAKVSNKEQQTLDTLNHIFKQL